MAAFGVVGVLNGAFSTPVHIVILVLCIVLSGVFWFKFGGFATICGLLIFQILSYPLLAENARIRTINRFLPQSTDSEGREVGYEFAFAFAYVDDNTCAWLTEGQRKLAEAALREEFQEIYFGLDNVPASKKLVSMDPKTAEVRGGLYVGYELEDAGIMWFHGR